MPPESYIIKGSIKVIDHFFNLPLDYNNENGPKIRIFVRHLIPLEPKKALDEQAKLPFLLYLQGGPGYEVDLINALKIAPTIHKHGYQTLWMDPRGTGLSTPFSADVCADKTDEEIFEYLKFFRADSIVRDCESIRALLLPASDTDPESQKWTILGQSFGGFCALTYLSFFPQGLKEVFLTGGLAPLGDHPDPVYLSLERKMAERNEIYYRKYPADIHRVRMILAFLETNAVKLPNGGHLTPTRFLQLGMEFGSQGGIDRVHQIILRATNDLEIHGKLSYRLLQNIQEVQTMDSNPLFAIMHEPIYCQGRAAHWAAERVLARFPQYQWAEMKKEDPEKPVYFFGEMVLPSMFDDYAGLRALKGAAHLVAGFAGWQKLYDLERLGRNEVKVTAATYFNDIYVSFDLAQQTAAAVKNTEQLISNEYFHGAVRTDGEAVLGALFRIAKREYD